MSSQTLAEHRENEVRVLSGWLMLPVCLGLLLGAIATLIYCIAARTQANVQEAPGWGVAIAALVVLPLSIVLLTGLFTLQPNEARLLILFGRYKGTVRRSGFHWGNPFYSNGNKQFGSQAAQRPGAPAEKAQAPTAQRGIEPRFKISLRARTFNAPTLKVNDKRGNPVEIAAVLVWRIRNTAQAAFDVDDFQRYVQTQSETALRHIASAYVYDNGEENELTLRSGMDEISQALRGELQERLDKAGVVVDEARLTHLAYAPEIAQAMLRRQQAEAVIAARQKIVHGAVSMVEMALRELAEKHVVQLDDERKAAMVSNLMVVLCGETEVHPIVNAGTLYT
jgi:regulator of protease activity HflC (stomatin/prohibitin superfamily)